jgi:coenzyme Q-binding protein COQ10
MPVFQAKRRVYHSEDEMFDLVADMERYPEFVPLCQRNAIRSREKQGEIEVLTTDMTIAYKIFRETFRNRVILDRANGRIVVESSDGPLRRLQVHWAFQSQAIGSCDVGFHLAYELESRTLALLMGAVFDAAFARLAQAFERRADVIYGRPAIDDRHIGDVFEAGCDRSRT